MNCSILYAYVPEIWQSCGNISIALYYQPIEQRHLSSYPSVAIAKVLKLLVIAILQNSFLIEKLAGIELARPFVNDKSFDDVGTMLFLTSTADLTAFLRCEAEITRV